jgi:hypothetical protein
MDVLGKSDNVNSHLQPLTCGRGHIIGSEDENMVGIGPNRKEKKKKTPELCAFKGVMWKAQVFSRNDKASEVAC